MSTQIWQYYMRMNATDLRVRGVSSGEEAYKRFINSVRQLNKTEDYVIQKLLKDPRMDKPRFREMPFRIMVFDDLRIENGYPHTHGSTIFLPQPFFLKDIDSQVNILLHEKVHIYQRLNPFKVNKILLEEFGFKVVRYVCETSTRRSNPDINALSYSDGHSGDEISSDYCPNATDLSNIKDSRDHPYEVMAYEIASDNPRWKHWIQGTDIP